MESYKEIIAGLSFGDDELIIEDTIAELSNGKGNDLDSFVVGSIVGVKFTNSPLVGYTRISPNRNSLRNQPISVISVHHCAGVISAESIGAIFSSPSRLASANYGIGYDCKIGMYVAESDRAWTSSNAANDNKAVTIEVSNNMIGGDWPISDTVFKKLVDLCVDICKRNNIPRLVYDGTTKGNLTIHSMFANTICCGPYLKRKLPDLCLLVNAQISPMKTPNEITVDNALSVGIINSPDYWLNVLNGKTTANPEYVKGLIDNCVRVARGG